MIPTTIFGVLLIVAATRYVLRPDRGRRAVTRQLAIVTLLAGCLGTVVGTMRTLLAAAQTDDVVANIAQGVGESLNCLGAGLTAVTLGAILTLIGTWRAQADHAELADPHRPT